MDCIRQMLGTYVTYQILIFQLQMDLNIEGTVDDIERSCFTHGRQLLSNYTAAMVGEMEDNHVWDHQTNSWPSTSYW